MLVIINRRTYARLGGHPPVLKALLRTFAPSTCQVTAGEALLKKQWLPVTLTSATVEKTRCTIAKTTGTSKAGRCLATLVHREEFTDAADDNSTSSLMTNRGHWLCGGSPYRWDNLQQQTKRSFHPHMAASMCKSGGDINSQQQKRSFSSLYGSSSFGVLLAKNNLDTFPVQQPNSRSLTTTSANLKKMSDEQAKAQTATPQEETIFSKMLKGVIPCKFIYEDERCVAFDDISPTAPVHFLVIPRKTIAQLSTASDDDEQLLGHLLLVGNKIAREQKKMDADGYRVVINNGRNGCQSVYHLHLHFIGGKQLGWPPGTD